MTKPTLLILAAGVGSRYGGFKQIDPVGPHGEIMLDYTVYDAWRTGFGKIVFVIREELDSAFREHFDARAGNRISLEYVHQKLGDLPAGCSAHPGREKPWGTGHAIWAARCAICEPFGVVNADDFYGRASYRALSTFLAEQQQEAAGGRPRFCMVAFVLRNTLSEHGGVSRGICSVAEDGYLTEVVERTRIEPAAGGGARYLRDDGQWCPLGGDEPASMNMWGFSPALFPALEALFVEFLRQADTVPKTEFYIPTVVDALIRQGACRAKVLHTDEKWFGMTYRDDREAVLRSLAELTASGVYPERLWDTA